MTGKSRLMPWAATALLVAVGCSDDERLQNPTNNQNNSQTNNNAGADAGTAEDAAVAMDAGFEDAGTMLGPRDDIEVLDLGSVTLAGGDSAEITFDLPADVTSFQVDIVGPDQTNFIIKRLLDPNGTMIVSDDASNVTMIEQFLLGPFAAQFKGPNRVIQDLGVASALFPNNPSVTVSGGTYTMVISGVTISGQSGTPYSGAVEVLVRYRTEVVTAGLLPVTLHFTGAGGIDAASAPTDSVIQAALVRMGEIYGQANISLGEITYLDADARYRTMPVGNGSLGLLEEMFASTADLGPGLHFFFVERFEGGFGGGVAGISGGLPGPGLTTGSVNSGVAVALSSVMGDPDVLAHVMAHEGGHWLGLFHTSEFTGTEDQLPDTPGGQAGENHLMFPAVGGGTMVSASQSDVLRRHTETIPQ